MPPFQLTQSPRTDAAAMGQQPPVSPDDAFKEGLMNMAYEALGKQSPDLIEDVITFRVFNAVADEGRGVGAFVMLVDGEIFYIPVIVSDSQLKPIDTFYTRQLDRYYPLTDEWLREATKSSIGTLGAGVVPPKTLRNDVDLREKIAPPMTGRYGFASEKTASVANAEIERGLAKLSRMIGEGPVNESIPRMLPGLLDRAPESVRLKVAAVLALPRIRAAAVRTYGKTALAAMLTPRTAKVATTAEKPMKRDVFVLDKSMPLHEIKEVVGPEGTAEAYRATRLHGFYVKDTRPSTDKLMELAESPRALVEPKEPGLYRIFMGSGSKEAIVVPNPIDPDPPYDFPTKKRSGYLILFKDGSCVRTYDEGLVAEPILSASYAEVKAFVGARLKDRPTNDGYGCFFSVQGSQIKVTLPGRADSVHDGQDGVRCRFNYGDTVVMSKTPGNRVIRQKGSNITHLGDGFRWLPLERDGSKKEDLYHTPEEVFRATESEVLAKGGKSVKVSQHGETYTVNGRGPLTIARAVEKIAREYNLSFPDTIRVMKLAAARPEARLYSLPYAVKTAGSPAGGGKKPAEGEDPNAEMAMDPAAMAAMMGPPQPPPPSGMDLAIAEQLQQIQMQQQALQDKATTLQSLQSRAMQIDGGGGAMAAPMGAAALQGGAPPPVAGMPPQDPSMGGQPPQGGGYSVPPGMGSPMMDSGMASMGGQPPPDPSQMGGMDPSMGGMPPGMDPSQMGGMPPGMDPSQMQPPPPPRAMMDESRLRPGNIEQQVNPQFLDQAAQLQDGDVFDVAAVSMLAKQKNLAGLLTAYVPNLEKALDNLARIRLQLAIKENDYKESIGNDKIVGVDQLLKDTFHNLGDAILQIAQLGEDTTQPG